MIICDNCSTPVTAQSRIPIPHRDDPYGEKDWCEGCANKYTELVTASAARLKEYKEFLAAEVNRGLKAYFEGLQNESI